MPNSPNILFLADENFDFRIIQRLRLEGFQILSIAEQSPSIADADVLAYAVEQDAVLLTEDKNFGELVYRLRLPHKGVLLVRLLKINVNQKSIRIFETLRDHGSELRNSFSVLSDDNLRIKSSKY